MGYQAGAILDCLPYFQQILDETPLNNLLVRSCRIYLENDFIIAGLKALANFTYKVTMPYLNCVEKSDQNYLVEMLPKLHRDLLNADMDTLCDYHVDWTHVNMKNHIPTTDLDNHLMKQMCLDAAAGVFLQCNREYWTSSATTTEKRATALHELFLKRERIYQLTTSAVSGIFVDSGILLLNQQPTPIRISKVKESEMT